MLVEQNRLSGCYPLSSSGRQKACPHTKGNKGDSVSVNFLDQIASDVQLMLRRPPRVQYAALCYRRNDNALEILLITSRDTGRWVIPKGWPMKGKRAHEVAAREAYEEAGVKGTCQRFPFGHYFYKKRLDHGLKISCRVQLHLLEVGRMRRKFPRRVSGSWPGSTIGKQQSVSPSLRCGTRCSVSVSNALLSGRWRP